ncbi:MAG: GspE/PulE family protein [Kiritimatiellaeota bacterium]|nr:GspE/PulE family protein [Kiritimatiellota bacterium]
MLTALLRQTGLFDEARLEQFEMADRSEDASVTASVVRLGMAQEEPFLRAAADVLGLEYRSVAETEISRELVERLPARAVYQYNIVPVSFEGNVLTVATSDPFNLSALDGLRLAAGCHVAAVVCTADEIGKQARKCYGVGAEAVEKMLDDGRYELEEVTDFSKFDLGDEGQEASIVRFVNQVIAEADRQRATDIHIEPMEHELRIRYRIDGVLHKVDVPPQLQRVQAAIISRIKVMATLDIAEKRMPMDGRIGIRANGKDIDIRVSTCPTIYGESVSLRLLQKSGSIVRLAQLGMNPRDEKIVTKAIHRPNGILLVTGPTGSGKSTSLYAYLHEINTVDKRIMTAEEPVEYEMPGINQVLVRPDIGLTFARILRSFLRQDPDIMMVGEIRDVETAEIAINASLTGHLVFSTLHTNDAAGAFIRLIDMGVEPFLVASSVAAVVAQRLVRRLCPDCKQPGKADATLAATLGLAPNFFDGKTVHDAVGCDLCGKTGYKGRGAIFEVLPITDTIESMIIARKSSGDIKAQAIAEGMTTLRDDGWNRVFAGFTTFTQILSATEDQTE